MSETALPSSNRTSGHYLIDLLHQAAEGDPTERRKFDLGFDVYIKQRSYAFINKIFFYSSLISTTAIAFWPAIAFAPWVKDHIELVGAAVVQTMITGFAAFSTYVYSHYKKKQTSAENLLRLIAFGDLPFGQMAATVRDEMARLDLGIGFRIKKNADDVE